VDQQEGGKEDKFKQGKKKKSLKEKEKVSCRRKASKEDNFNPMSQSHIIEKKP